MKVLLYDGLPEISRGLQFEKQVGSVVFEVKQVHQDGLSCAAVAGRTVVQLQRGADPCGPVGWFTMPSLCVPGADSWRDSDVGGKVWKGPQGGSSHQLRRSSVVPKMRHSICAKPTRLCTFAP